MYLLEWEVWAVSLSEKAPQWQSLDKLKMKKISISGVQLDHFHREHQNEAHNSELNHQIPFMVLKILET